jgi:pimeloyl-ACP methyl ester carboxylesterase
MASFSKLSKSFVLFLLPTAVLLVIAVIGIAFWFLQSASVPPVANYLITPENYIGLSVRGSKITDETWVNKDGSSSRGWLLPGNEGSPAVVLLHRYGTDRSHLLNLGVKLNEITNFTILMPDLRGHGVNPVSKHTTFGGTEANDLLGGIDFLRSLKTAEKNSLVGKSIGVYGTEIGAFAALKASESDENIRAIILDSAPMTSDDLLASVIQKRFPFASFVTSYLAKFATYPYFQSDYTKDSSCNIASRVSQRNVFLMASSDVPSFQKSTIELGKCFTFAVESKTDLSISGYSTISSTGKQEEAYDQRVVEFFKKSLMP